MLLEGRVAVITGAAAGIGQATALLFAREGAKVFCIDDSPSQETIEKIRDKKRAASYFVADVSNSEQVQKAARKCAAIMGKVDVLFNNAGRIINQRFEETTEETWATMLGINLTGAFLCSRYFVPLLKKAGSASIINHASVDAVFGNPSIAAYTAAKGGLIPLTHVMAHDLGKYNIRVNCLSTGGICTAMSAPGQESRILITPLQRSGTPEEAAHAALFLACDWSSFVNGANLIVDGGRTSITQGTYHG
ncbi:MAG: hypothetical protein A3H27_14910 [Acidobacteria bacterium RIFCSPLOWO2_02_FULL_59_13]|nr:MAG: hypothetical protein A3H27_14910 [Acidobacteria bacterium RIFCSPLOWO2_02_FULL_59_13]